MRILSFFVNLRVASWKENVFRDVYIVVKMVSGSELFADAQVAGKSRQSVFRQPAIGESNHCANRRWIGAHRVRKARADLEAFAIRRFDSQGAHFAFVFHFAGRVTNHRRFSVLQRFQL